ncbi:egg cell-secreted protein 1.1-like [Andrographis paniculata]|uniref:egg cell-secreted protein 1.1-like n=1 Tax=Andrographis paniculata TaxID=175694 RepID=UPI0021E97617|nr:egg cell-secreted protein 1.1-like [Andrographis paniculata]
MAYSRNHCKLQAILLASFLASSATIVSGAGRVVEDDNGVSLMSRLKVDEDGKASSCWEALFQIQACSGEVVLFFMNGETRLGAGCCSAISTIEHQCWPSILGAIGITPEESDILRGYCDAAATVAAPPPDSSCKRMMS